MREIFGILGSMGGDSSRQQVGCNGGGRKDYVKTSSLLLSILRFFLWISSISRSIMHSNGNKTTTEIDGRLVIEWSASCTAEVKRDEGRERK